MKRVLVTGAAGFVGANLARRLLEDGHEVHLLVRPESDPWRLRSLRGHVNWHRVDLRDAAGVRRVVDSSRPEWIFHLAAHGGSSWQTNPDVIRQTNLAGTVHLVEACCDHGFEVLVNTGTSLEYGPRDQAPAEDAVAAPACAYAAAKAEATHFCCRTARACSLRIPTLRLYSVYGDYESPARLIPTLLVRALEGGWPPLASPSTARDFVHIADVVEAYLGAATVPSADPGAVYNIGTGVQTRLAEVVALVGELLGVDTEPPWGSLADRTWDTPVWQADARKAAAQLGWVARTSLREGLVAFRAWLGRGWLDYYRQRLRPGV